MLRKTTIQSLPREILHIITQLRSDSFHALRLVCRSFNDVVAPQMFSHTRVSFDSGRTNDLVEYLQALATRVHPAPDYATSVTIAHLRFLPEFAWHETRGADYDMGMIVDPLVSKAELIQTYLPLAISAFRRVTTVRWFLNAKVSHTRVRELVVAGLTRMPYLRKLELHAEAKGVPELQSSAVRLDALPPLQSLKIYTFAGNISEGGEIQGVPELIAKSSALLTHLHLDITPRAWVDEPLTVDPLLELSSLLRLTHLTLKGCMIRPNSSIAQHLKSLVFLSIKDGADAETRVARRGSSGMGYSSNDIWTCLGYAQIYLREIELDEPTGSFIQYLQSYTDLEKLSISYAMSVSEMESNALALAFYAVIPAHQRLEQLTITPAYEGHWCFGAHNAEIFPYLVNLRQLTISITCDSSEIVPVSPLYYVQRTTLPLHSEYYLATPVVRKNFFGNIYLANSRTAHTNGNRAFNT
ncbi:hypothetical protein BDQ17DRAFT_1349878 [Cyathus striatus]|nr:hypothetical protein BDQ17DRAFT_1349878 [Cyathus striatus]